jgi:hypothetical protein
MMSDDDLHIPRLRQLDLTPRRAYRPTSWWTAAETGDVWRQAAHAAQQRQRQQRRIVTPDREGR